MRILAIDVGTGTQDILLFDTNLQPENCFKLIMPSPTMMVANRVNKLAGSGAALFLSGVTIGGGPCHWAVRDYASAGNRVYATPGAARTFDDDLSQVETMGIYVVNEDDEARLTVRHDNLVRIKMHDFDFHIIEVAFANFGISLELDGVAVAVFDHGVPPAGMSDRQFRFDYLDKVISETGSLSGFAYTPASVPPFMTRLQSVITSAAMTGVPAPTPLLVMDTAPAAIYGALEDASIPSQDGGHIVANIGNFHTLAFRIANSGIGGLFEHHTGEINCQQLDELFERLADSTLTHAEVFNNMGHGALVYDSNPLTVGKVIVTGPRRQMLRDSRHSVYYAVPHGDMMVAGCYGLIKSWADHFPQHADSIRSALRHPNDRAPWDRS
jgi:uncharacterized protein (DUF1786 family)